MKPRIADSLNPIAALIALLFAVAAHAPLCAEAEGPRGEDPVIPEAIQEGYRELTRAIRGEDLPAFMGLFDMDFLYEAPDGSCIDRGPWRRVWLEKFERLEYERVSIRPESLLSSDEEQVVVRARRIFVARESGASDRRLEMRRTEDTWTRAADPWQLIYQKDLPAGADGTVASETIPAAALRDAKTAPLIWPEDEMAAERRVTFLWRGRGGEQSVALEGAGSSADHPLPLAQIPDTDLWLRTVPVPAGARFTYRFHVATRVELPAEDDQPRATFLVRSVEKDPLQPAALGAMSLFEMPGAKRSPWAEPVSGRPEGSMERHGLMSEVLEERRILHAYSPPAPPERGEPAWLVIALGAGDLSSREALRVLLDNLQTELKTPPLFAVMLQEEGSRSTTFELSESLVRFVSEEVMPWAGEQLGARFAPERTVIGGSGIGGAVAVWCAMEHPELFRKVLVHSGALHSRPVEAQRGESQADCGSWLAAEIAKAERKPLAFHIEAGRLDGLLARSTSRHLRDVLAARGYPVTLVEYAGNGNALTWQDALAAGLLDLLEE
ncbi:MAG: DUF3327 domain-containing protein [Planctomycetes bacterium]|nr:DUF3327 domain-containing protein [Planctomycetota bacterium]